MGSLYKCEALNRDQLWVFVRILDEKLKKFTIYPVNRVVKAGRKIYDVILKLINVMIDLI